MRLTPTMTNDTHLLEQQIQHKNFSSWKKISKTKFKNKITGVTVHIQPMIADDRFNSTIGAIALLTAENESLREAEKILSHEGDIDEFESRLADWMEDYHMEVMNQ